MQISDSQTNEAELAALGADAVRLLCLGDLFTLTSRYEYAVALGRESVAAIRDDLAYCLTELRAACLLPVAEGVSATVKYFAPNDAGLFALVQSLAPAENGAEVLVELVVTIKETHKHVTLEQLSVAA